MYVELEKQKARGNLGDLYLIERIILKFILKSNV
jgi:hypothetical protein